MIVYLLYLHNVYLFYLYNTNVIRSMHIFKTFLKEKNKPILVNISMSPHCTHYYVKMSYIYCCDKVCKLTKSQYVIIITINGNLSWIVWRILLIYFHWALTRGITCTQFLWLVFCVMFYNAEIPSSHLIFTQK